MIEIVGWVGAWLLAFCALPQAIYSVITGRSDGISHTFLWMWFIGEALILYANLAKELYFAPNLFNWGLNLCFLCVIIKYKYWPRH